MNLLTAFAAFSAGTIVGISALYLPVPEGLHPWVSPIFAAFGAVLASTLMLNQREYSSRDDSESDEEDRQKGTVKWFNATKGFGFVICEDGKEIFVHFRALKHGGRRSLKDGSRISFVVTHGDRGPQASEVIIL